MEREREEAKERGSLKMDGPSPRARRRDAVEPGDKRRRKGERVLSNRTAESAAARCSAGEVAATTQGARLMAMPGLVPEVAPTGRVITTTGFPQGRLVRW